MSKTIQEKALTIQNIHKSDSVKYALVERGYDSSTAIFQKPEWEFLDDVKDILPEEEAKHVYQQAASNYTLLTHLVMDLNDSYGSPSYRALRSRFGGGEPGATFEDIPDYQQIFGGLDYCKCPHCKSIFGPAAYFVDLMRIIDKYIKPNQAKTVPLSKRRKDLFDLPLTCENTNNQKPYIEIANGILEDLATSYFNLTTPAQMYTQLAKTYYPRGLPFHLPLQKLQLWLQKKDTSLQDILKIWNREPKRFAAAAMGLTQDFTALLEKELPEDKLKELLNLQKASEINYLELSKLSNLLKALQMTEKELREVLYQDMADEVNLSNPQNTSLHNLFFNQRLVKFKYLYIDKDQVKNLEYTSLERLVRFIFLAKILDISYEHLSWIGLEALLNHAGKGDIGLLCELAAITKTSEGDPYTALFYLGNFKDWGSNPYYKLFHCTKIEAKGFTDVQKVQLVSRLLELPPDYVDTIQRSIPIGHSRTLESLYLHCRIAASLRLSGEEYVLLVTLNFSSYNSSFTPKELAKLCRYQQFRVFSIHDLDYLVNGTVSPYYHPCFTMDAFSKQVELIRSNVTEECKKDKAALKQYVCSELGAFCAHTGDEIERILLCWMNPASLEAWITELANKDINVKQLEPNAVILNKYLMFLRVGVSLDLLNRAAQKPACFAGADSQSFPLDKIFALVAYQQYIEYFDDKENALLNFISEFTQGQTYASLAKATGWKAIDLEALVKSRYPDASNREKNISVFLEAIVSCMNAVKKLAISVEQAAKLVSLPFTEASYDGDFSAVKELCSADIICDEDFRAAVEEKKRNALLPIALLQMQKTFVDMTNPDKLYKYFLIDVKMDDKTRISPIKEGINALQLYLQRCRMHLEKEVEAITFPESWWSWLMDYRVWEANRKIFVYPENYLLPSIRQNKTALFKEGEAALQQAKQTPAYVEEQYIAYLDRYSDLTQLKICGAYETMKGSEPVMFLFARTQQQPYTYYYCQQVGTLAWTEWEKIEASIDSDLITPAFVFNRLYIFWSSIKENSKVKVKGSNQMNAANQVSYEMEIKYTYLNLQNKWLPPQTLAKDLILYASDDQAGAGSIDGVAGAANSLNITAPDSDSRRLTILRLTAQNLDPVMDTGVSSECFAIMTGSFSQNVGLMKTLLPLHQSMDREMEAFKEFLNHTLENNNHQVLTGGNGYISTGFFRVYNEDMEETHFFSDRDYAVVDSYLPPQNAMLFTALYDKVHRTVGVELSQSVLQNAANSTNRILHSECSDEPSPVHDRSFVMLASNAQAGSSPEPGTESHYAGEENVDIIGDGLSLNIFAILLSEKILKGTAKVGPYPDIQQIQLTLADFFGMRQDFREIILKVHTIVKYSYDGRVQLSSLSFISNSNPTLSEEDSYKIFGILYQATILHEGLASVQEEYLYAANLEALLGAVLSGKIDDRFEFDTRCSNQLQFIQNVLAQHLGGIPLFRNASQADIIPVLNRPGKFLFDTGNETFLLYPVKKEVVNGNSISTPLNLSFTDLCTTIGTVIPKTKLLKITKNNAQLAEKILKELKDKGIVNSKNVFQQSTDTYNKSKDALKNVLVDEHGNFDEKLFDELYKTFTIYPIIHKDAFDKIEGITKDIIIEVLTKALILFPYEGRAGYYLVNYFAIKNKAQLNFKNAKGGELPYSSVEEIFRRLSNAICAVNFGFRWEEGFKNPLPNFHNLEFGAQRLTNPSLKHLKHRLETGGISRFLSRETQSPPKNPVMPFSRLDPSKQVIPPVALDGAQVDFEGLYETYNWELFYHLPITIAENFQANSYYEEALHWFHYIFDPTKPKSDLNRYYWNFYPFTYNENEALEHVLQNEAAIITYRNYPFDPHAIARLRTNAYGKYTVMSYVQNIIQWGDSQFIQNTWESLTTATLMYVWAKDLLGPKPEQVGEVAPHKPMSFAQIRELYNGQDIPDFIIKLEGMIQASPIGHKPVAPGENAPYNDIRSYFGVPENEQILQLWDIVEDRLYKLRNSLDINGAPRVTSLFEAPLDPMALVKTMAANGPDKPKSLTGKGSLYPYRFSYMLEQAKALAMQLSQLGGSLLAALEKKDAEALLMLTNTQEKAILNMTTSIKEGQISEISHSINALQESKKSTQKRYDFYKKNVDENLSAQEEAALDTSLASAGLLYAGCILRNAAGISYLVPQVGSPFAMKFGGKEMGDCLGALASGVDSAAGLIGHAAQMITTMAQYERRKQEWELQRDMAELEVKNLDAQLESLLEKQRYAVKELEIHKRTIAFKEEVLNHLKHKFSNTQLYQWLSGKLNTTMWQTYQIALELCLAAQEAYQNEKDEKDIFLSFDYWENSHKGLMSGECLLLALERMQQSYQRKSFRRLEIEKSISLKTEFPDKFEEFRKNGTLKFQLEEKLFAKDYPSAYRRKISNISITVPAVLPPYETVQAILKQTDSYVLLTANKQGIDFLFRKGSNPGENIVKQVKRNGEKIALSRGIDDHGMFTVNFNDERYLPFEGTGAHSTWELEMPKDCNRFQLSTISDIILTVRYTALEDESRGTNSFYEYVRSNL